MQLKRLQHYFGEFERFLRKQEATDRLYIWESQVIFQENWNNEATDWALMYDQSLQNSTSRRLWKREAFEPKRLMLLFLEMEPEYVKQAFRDLFNEEKSVDGRMDRFVFYCDELLRMYRERHPHSIENNHYHGNDYDMISLYLTFRFPADYVPYDLGRLIKLLRTLGVGQLPQANDPVRYFKVARTLNKLMQKEVAILERHRERIDQNGQHECPGSLLLVHDFMSYLTEDRYESAGLRQPYRDR